MHPGGPGNILQTVRQVGLLERPPTGVGTHVCWLYDDSSAFVRAAETFLAEGARKKERLVYVADASATELADQLASIDVERLTTEGQLLLQPVHALYQPDGIFDAAAQVEVYRSLVAGALADGFTGLRVAADAGALVATHDAHRRFLEYELAVDRVMATSPMSALCAYRASEVGDRIDDLFGVHPCSHGGEPDGLHAYWEGPTLVLGGEADVRTEAVFDAVLFSLHRVPSPTQLDAHDLRFVDVRSLVRLGQAAGALAAAGRRLQVHGLSAAARRCASLLDLDPLLEAVAD